MVPPGPKLHNFYSKAPSIVPVVSKIHVNVETIFKWIVYVDLSSLSAQSIFYFLLRHCH